MQNRITRYEAGKDNKKTTNILEKNHFHPFSGITLSVIALIAFSLIYQKSYADKIYKGVMISGVDIGGSTKEEADRILREKNGKISDGSRICIQV